MLYLTAILLLARPGAGITLTATATWQDSAGSHTAQSSYLVVVANPVFRGRAFYIPRPDGVSAGVRRRVLMPTNPAHTDWVTVDGMQSCEGLVARGGKVEERDVR